MTKDIRIAQLGNTFAPFSDSDSILQVTVNSLLWGGPTSCKTVYSGRRHPLCNANSCSVKKKKKDEEKEKERHLIKKDVQIIQDILLQHRFHKYVSRFLVFNHFYVNRQMHEKGQSYAGVDEQLNTVPSLRSLISLPLPLFHSYMSCDLLSGTSTG